MKKILCVDLDGSFLRTDSLWEAIFVLLKTKPYKFLSAFFFVLNKARFKDFIAQHVSLDWNVIPINQEVLSFCQNQKLQGAQIYLVTGANERLMAGFEKIYPFFDGLICSNEQINLTGSNKAQKLCDEFGANNFDYIGNSSIDLAVWQKAKSAYYVGDKKHLANKIDNLQEHFFTSNTSIKKIIKLMRVHQWSKSALIFFPIILAHRVRELNLWQQALEAFVIFSFIASAIYIFNDLLDLESDRYNSKKRNRPIACGDVSIPLGMFLAVMLLVIASLTMFIRLPQVIPTYLLYIALNLLYTLRVKRDAPFDLFLLAYFYNIRLMVGGAATGIELSHWLQNFSLFFFLSLGVIKRYSEVYFLYNHEGRFEAKGRGYNAKDLPFLAILGVGSGLVSIMLLSLYLFQKELPVFYHRTDLLWFIPMLLLIWLTHLWLKTTRGTRIEEPVKYIFTDKFSIGIFAVMAVLFLSSL